MLNSIRPLSQGTRTRRSTSCCRENKGEETSGSKRGRRRAVRLSIAGSQAHLLGKGRKGSLTVGRRRRERASERGFPAETRDAAELWTAPRERAGSQAPLWEALRPGSSALLDPDPRSSHECCLNVPGGGAALLPLARSGRRVSGSGNPVLVDNASLLKKEKFWGLVGGGRGKADSGRKKVDGWFPALTWKE